jgi:DNA-binding CsgD family transcriptional regulator
VAEFLPSADRLNALIAGIYDAVLDPCLWPDIMDGVAAACGGMGMMVYPVGKHGGAASFVYASNDVEEAARNFGEEWYETSPFMARERQSPLVGRSIWDGDIYALDQMPKLDFYQGYARKYDMAHCMMRGTSPTATQMRYVMMVTTSLRKGLLDEAQMQVFNILSTHAEKALGMHIRLNASADQFKSALTLMDRQNCGIVLLDGRGCILEINDAAGRLTGDGILIDDRRLLAACPSQQTDLDRLLRSALNPEVGTHVKRPLALKRANGKRPIIVNALPLSGRVDTPVLALQSPRKIAVLVIDPDGAPVACDWRVFMLFGLTAAEARVASILGAGARPELAATQLQLSIETVRGHLKRIFAKLDLSRQSELVAFAAGITSAQSAQRKLRDC